MPQPFRTGHEYVSTIIEGLSIRFKQEHLLIKTQTLMETLSSALWGGGWTEANRFINWKVPLSYRCDDPHELMGYQLKEWGYDIERSIGLQTAAKLTHASIYEETGDCFSILCCTTAGTSNGARSGRKREVFSAYRCGTINTFIMIDGRMSAAAMVNALMTATEAKAAALQDLRVVDKEGQIATGTTTDSVVIAVSQSGFDEVHAFAGVATSIGNAIGRLVYQSVHEAVRTQGEK